MVPKYLPVDFEDEHSQEQWNRMYPDAIGNTLTCKIDGSLIWYGVLASALFTGSMAVSFLLQVKFKFQKKQMRIAEYFFFAVSIAYPLTAITIILLNGSFHPETTKRNCSSVSTPKLGLLYVVPGVFVFILNISCMAMLFWSVRTQELSSARWSTNAAAGRNQRRCFVKAMLYLGIYLIVWIPIIMVTFFPSKTTLFIDEFFIPLQGFFNALVYSDFFRIASVARKVVRPNTNNREKNNRPNTNNGEKNKAPSSSADTIPAVPPSLTADDKEASQHRDEENQYSDTTASDST